MDAIYYKIKDNEKYINKAVYTILGINLQGKKEILGLYLSESEGVNRHPKMYQTAVQKCTTW